eukprot:GCRY01001935.1.p1 GENE.GCRY01001935.1~~GCRY01001935.1.p1  ORF type:complete len:512 (-),score=149.70 GCRY01001935.1:438-1973(-)
MDDNFSEDVLKVVDGAAEGEALDSLKLKRLVLGLEKSVNRNRELRIKYSDQPMKFIESEIDLDDSIKKLSLVATAPHLFKEFIELNVLATLVELMIHDNLDIMGDVVELLQELTDPDNISEDPTSAPALVKALIDADILKLFMTNLKRLKEGVDDNSQIVYNMLAVVENLTEDSPAFVDMCLRNEDFLAWLLDRVRVKGFDQNKLYASEVLSILLQDNNLGREKVGALNGIDKLLHAAAAYKRRDPQSEEELEMLENVFDVLCSCLMLQSNQKLFVEAEGIQLLLIMIKAKKEARHCALRALNHALADCPVACEVFVDVFGLRTLFSALMLKGLSKKQQKKEATAEEHILSAIASLFKNLPPTDPRYKRLAYKFVENEFEKIDRLVELHQEYYAQVDASVANMPKATDEDEEEILLLRRLDAGLFTLQQIDLIIAYAVAFYPKHIKPHLMQMLRQNDIPLRQLIHIIEELAETQGTLLEASLRQKRSDQYYRLASVLRTSSAVKQSEYIVE